MRQVQYRAIGLFFFTLLVFSCSFTSTSVVFGVTKPSIKINADAKRTSDREVILTLVGTKRVNRMRLGNSREELENARWQDFREEWKNWYLTDVAGNKTVYVQFDDQEDGISSVYSDSISYTPTQEGFLTINGTDDKTTGSNRVTLSIGVPPDARRMRLSNDVDIADAAWQTTKSKVTWRLKEGTGIRTVHLQFEYTDKRISNIFQDSIEVLEDTKTAVKVLINRGAKETKTPRVLLSFDFSDDIRRFRISNTEDFSQSGWYTSQTSLPWVLTSGRGTKKVFLEVETINKKTKTASDTIEYNPTEAIVRQEQKDQAATAGNGVLGPGSIVAFAGSKTVYYYGYDGLLHPFDSQEVFYSWYTTFSDLVRLDQQDRSRFTVGASVCVRPGTSLVRFVGNPTVYAVEYGCHLRPLRSEVEAFILFGSSWATRIISLPVSVVKDYGRLPYLGQDRFLDPEQDGDGDGISSDDEKVAGTSDRDTDTDRDSLSDYEEMWYWFTDPTVADTDGDGMNDGAEIMAKRSPVGETKISSMPKDTYRYPFGTLIRSGTNYYLYGYDGARYEVGRGRDDVRFRELGLQERFSARPGLSIKLSSKINKKPSADDRFVQPAVYVDGVLTAQ